MAAAEALGLDLRPPGGESPRQVQDRLKPWLAERSSCGRDTIAVTHKGVIRALYALACGWDMTGPPPDKLRDLNCPLRSEERRVGKEGVRPFRSRWSPYH